MIWNTIKKHKWIKKILDLFRQGLSPKPLSMSIVVGAVVGVLPLFGVSTLITGTLAVWLRLNLPIALFFTYAVSPIHLLLFIPFIRVGEYILNAEHTLLTFTAIKEAFSANFFSALYELSLEVLCGVTGWALVAIPVSFILYQILCGILTFFGKTKKNELEKQA